MSEIFDTYTGGIKSKLKHYWPTWLPSSKVTVGDVGILQGNYFERLTTLKELNIQFKVSDRENAGSLDIVSEKGVTVIFKLAGEQNDKLDNVPTSSAGVLLRFAGIGSFMVQCPKSSEEELRSPLDLQKKILTAFENGVWQREWLVVTRLIKAPVATFIISNTSDSELQLSATADLSAGLSDLAKVSSELSLRSQSGEVIKLIGAQDVTPFFQLGGLKTRLFGTPRFKSRSIRSSDLEKKNIESSELVFDLLRDEDVLSST